jgi:hypothetical protein
VESPIPRSEYSLKIRYGSIPQIERTDPSYLDAVSHREAAEHLRRGGQRWPALRRSSSGRYTKQGRRESHRLKVQAAQIEAQTELGRWGRVKLGGGRSPEARWRPAVGKDRA